MEGKSWVVEVVDEAAELMEIMEAENKDWGKHSIYKLPACVTDLNSNAYMPRAISFGPYHYDDPKLRPMEVHKRRAVRRLINRTGKSMEYYVKVLKVVAKDLKDAYESLDPKWEEEGSEEFVGLMIRDGCFMLEILRYFDGQGTDGYVANDPIFSNHGRRYMMPYIRRDMLMLENQLPMLLLTKLLFVEDDQQTQEEDKEKYINKLIIQFCSPASNPYHNLGKCLHVLDVYRKILILGDGDQKVGIEFSTRTPVINLRGGNDILPSATQLYEAGITIRKSNTSSITDIDFKPNIFGGVLTLPPINVDDSTEPVFLNLIAFERFHVGIGNEVTSYISFMDDIIDNQRDVNLLQTHDIVENAYGSDKAVAKLLNSLSKDVTLDPESRLFDLRSMAKRHCKRPWNRSWGFLIHTYFSNPWTGISLIAAIFLFGLTIIQTIYTIKQYLQQTNSSS